MNENDPGCPRFDTESGAPFATLGTVQPFTQLRVWQRGHALALNVYRTTADFPSHERYGLTAQVRRAVLSVPTNIAEGSKREGRLDYARFLNFAEASLAETQYLLLMSRDLGYLADGDYESVAGDAAVVARMLHGLRRKVVGEGRAAESR